MIDEKCSIEKALLSGNSKITLTTKFTDSIRGFMLGFPYRNWVINKIKKPLMDMLVTIASKLPEPTLSNITKHNTHVLLALRDEFFKHEQNPQREALFKAVFKLFILEMEHDWYYEQRICWLLEQIKKSDWEIPTELPSQCWRDKI